MVENSDVPINWHRQESAFFNGIHIVDRNRHRGKMELTNH